MALVGEVVPTTLAEVVRDARVVVLGEPTHGDGPGMRALTEMVRALHVNHGFGIVAFESPAFCAERAWQRLLAIEGDIAGILRQGIFPMWSRAAEVAPLWDHIAAHASDPLPLRLAGLDCQLLRPHGLGPFLKCIGDDRTEVAELAILMQGRGGERSEALLNAWADRAGNDAALLRAVHGLRRYHHWVKHSGNQPGSDVHWARDEWMAQELLRLVDASDDRIVVWAASFHACRGSQAIEGVTGDGLPFATAKRMGDGIARELGDDARFISIIAGTGSFGRCDATSITELDPAAPGSLEAACASFAVPTLIRPPAGTYLAGPFGYDAVRARWADVVDAFLYIPEMKPATLLAQGATRALVE